jgi:hypothetical protein
MSDDRDITIRAGEPALWYVRRNTSLARAGLTMAIELTGLLDEDVVLTLSSRDREFILGLLRVAKARYKSPLATTMQALAVRRGGARFESPEPERAAGFEVWRGPDE